VLRLPEAPPPGSTQSYSGGISRFLFPPRWRRRRRPPRLGPRPRAGRSFVVGDGDARISIESFSGGVKIERGD
jgi:hypothetical protein